MRHPVRRQASNASFNTATPRAKSPRSIINFPERKRPAVCQKGALMCVAASIRRAMLCSAAAKSPVVGMIRHMPKYSTRQSTNGLSVAGNSSRLACASRLAWSMKPSSQSARDRNACARATCIHGESGPVAVDRSSNGQRSGNLSRNPCASRGLPSMTNALPISRSAMRLSATSPIRSATSRKPLGRCQCLVVLGAESCDD